MDLASIYFGLFLGIFIFTLVKIIQQTRGIFKRTRSLANAYLYMIWTEAWVNFVFAHITFLYLNDVIPGRLAFYLATVGLWSIQTQLLPQIIANRVALIMVNKRRARHLKWGLFVLIGFVNVAVCYIWTVAHLDGASEFQVELNHIFEKFEKSFFLVVDLGLNLYFLYLVRYRLIADGLTKYWRLFNFNAGMILLSTSMDTLLLGFLSLPDPYLYVQFAPVAYIVKLYIELMMAVLISKVVRSGPVGRGDWDSSGHKSNPTNPITSRVVVSGGRSSVTKSVSTFLSKIGRDTHQRPGSADSEIELATNPCPNSITRTVETTIVVARRDESDEV